MSGRGPAGSRPVQHPRYLFLRPVADCRLRYLPVFHDDYGGNIFDPEHGGQFRLSVHIDFADLCPAC